MREDTLREAARLAGQVGHVWIATVDSGGVPHVTVASRLEWAGEGSVAATEWFCPGTVANLRSNPSVSVVVWERDSNRGYQLLGTVERMIDSGIMDGYAPQEEKGPPLPQVQEQLKIHVEKVFEFRLGPHCDEQV